MVRRLTVHPHLRDAVYHCPQHSVADGQPLRRTNPKNHGWTPTQKRAEPVSPSKNCEPQDSTKLDPHHRPKQRPHPPKSRKAYRVSR